MFKRFFCDHDDELVNQFEMKSQFDIVRETHVTPKSFTPNIRVVVSDYKCSNCGRIKRLREETRS